MNYRHSLWLLLLGWALLVGSGNLEASITLDLGSPDYLGCGDVSINGFVGTTVGQIERLVWEWGDGSTNENWFPARHNYLANGAYTVQVTAFASGGETFTKSVSVTVTNAGGTDCQHITLQLSSPDYLGCSDVSINGFVATTVGQIERLVWEWGDGTTKESWFPAQHRYSSNGAYEAQVTAYSSAGETLAKTVAVVLTTLVPACDNTFRVYPPLVVLKNGKTSETLVLDLRDHAGQPVRFAMSDVTFSSSQAALVQVDTAGRVTSTGLGEAQIEVSMAGQPRRVLVPVVAGEILLTPPILLLCLQPFTAGQVQVAASNADGSPVDVAGRPVVFTGGNAVASVSPQGLVTPLRSPVQFWDSPYVTATLDGMPAGNACFVRVTESNLNLTMTEHAGQHISLTVADQVGPYAYGQLLQELQASHVVDALYRLEQRLSGTTPSRGARQFFVMDPGVDADGTVPCGLSGNPIRLGVGVDNLRSCLGGADWIQWGVIGHELAHDFLSQAGFADFLSGLSNSSAYSEGLATALSVYSFEQIGADPQRFGLAPETINSFRGMYLHLGPDNVRQLHYATLTNYEANPQYATQFNADLLDAMMLKLGDDYGAGFMFRLMSVFYPPDEVFLSYQNEAQRLTFWVAACSAAAQADLRIRFRDQWGYPLDDIFYERILPLVAQRAGQRDPLIRSVSVDANGLRLGFHAIPDTIYVIQQSPDLVAWSSLTTNTATGFTVEYLDPMPSSATQRFYRVRQEDSGVSGLLREAAWATRSARTGRFR